MINKTSKCLILISKCQIEWSCIGVYIISHAIIKNSQNLSACIKPKCSADSSCFVKSSKSSTLWTITIFASVSSDRSTKFGRSQFNYIIFNAIRRICYYRLCFTWNRCLKVCHMTPVICIYPFNWFQREKEHSHFCPLQQGKVPNPRG